MSDEGDAEWLTLSTLQHYAYCPRQASLLREGVWADNHITVEGTSGHTRVDAGGADHRRGVTVHHNVALVSHVHHIYGIADAIECAADGILMPVEHKRGRGAGNLFPTIAQTIAQAICLEEMLHTLVPAVAIYITKEKRRELVRVNEYRDAVINLIAEARVALQATIPAAYQPRLCTSCSVQNACQPRGVQWL
ncbi:CRISPR-associated protein Cas4 [Gordonia sp. (in: high G+C Gram-positive bacteria)]|jgi:CRISPR-associated exonuclease Cas4|uniref:CRISPR-associated protein Cas4 n=1 Tax=Gordonia sp. (in: high G+C Gram-positive bacteria) TaxID=84139 RepID=UPI001D4C99FE|nr:CRISPR-associated protein Cas4 [Gordonia sp. (in: high G+C Gram-positive bacteria)]MCB1293996.1 CRISPR-associated protein Cas4 [Gordonia sp. (in: high G+C Gram-positive bacteria)]HMS75565.1 CRISPR-associated protein Cas4 [Gordonia sp. (in: high G+C Gram-positive bacteria)]HQV16854.1 CRISPR-associated protein Cas4 [Gordonia sp. (in: high G+C Gram-positive bacteria)]